MSDTELVRELKSVGLPGCAVRGGIIVTDLEGDASDLAELVQQAHEKADGDPALKLLRAYLKPEAWASYVAMRNRAVRNARRDRFVEETDPIKFKRDELQARGDLVGPHDLEVAWLAAKDRIREELPYAISE